MLTSDFKVHGVTALRVVDASVFPRIPGFFIASAVYMLFPFVHTAGALMAMSFTLGLGLGMSQPMVMALLHIHAPPGRTGEAAGVRMSLVQAMAVAVPLTFGTLGATIGLTPVFWAVGASLAAGGYLARRPAR